MHGDHSIFKHPIYLGNLQSQYKEGNRHFLKFDNIPDPEYPGVRNATSAVEDTIAVYLEDDIRFMEVPCEDPLAAYGSMPPPELIDREYEHRSPSSLSPPSPYLVAPRRRLLSGIRVPKAKVLERARQNFKDNTKTGGGKRLRRTNRRTNRKRSTRRRR